MNLREKQGCPDRHRYMAGLVRTLKDQGFLRILEIGSWAGYSAITWATALKKYNIKGEIICVDPWIPYQENNLKGLSDSIYTDMENALISGEIFNKFNENIKNFGFIDIIHSFRGKSEILLPLLPKNKFDIIFIDGAHDYDTVKKDIQLSLPLLKIDGILCGDDLERQVFEMEKADILYADSVKQFDYLMGYHPGVTLAVNDILGKVKEYNGFWVYPNITINVSDIDIPEHMK